MAKPNKKTVTVLKLVISAVLIYFIFTKIDFKVVWTTLKATRPFYIVLAVLFFVISKLIASVRLNLYFHGLSIFLTQKSNAKLYLLGMFYNLFLPGGIGGDAYKGYIIKKKFKIDTKKVVSVLVLDRLSGLLLLFVYACILAAFLKNDLIKDFKVLLVIAIVLAISAFWLLHKKFFSYILPVFWPSFGYSALVQFSQLLSIYCILISLQVHLGTITYLFIFLLSSIVSVVPLTIGGLGSREITFFYGAQWLHLDQNTSISISMVFFIITAVISLLGIVYHFKKPKLDIKRESIQ